jgi:FMN phosphatase YigB (HAD superfamily)
MEKLIIFDLDGTIVTEPEFYRQVYSGTLNEVVYQTRGIEGMKMLGYCRKHYRGKGELALIGLDIPFEKWAEKLIKAPLDMIQPKPLLVEQIRSLAVKKALYTGSPTEMAGRIIKRIGFGEDDFDFLVGWENPETFPIKWTCSSFTFREMARHFQLSPSECWAIGNEWETDLAPAKKIGMRTALIAQKGGGSDVRFGTLENFLDFVVVENTEKI